MKGQKYNTDLIFVVQLFDSGLIKVYFISMRTNLDLNILYNISYEVSKKKKKKERKKKFYFVIVYRMLSEYIVFKLQLQVITSANVNDAT
jgi:hypothetical protein